MQGHAKRPHYGSCPSICPTRAPNKRCRKTAIGVNVPQGSNVPIFISIGQKVTLGQMGHKSGLSLRLCNAVYSQVAWSDGRTCRNWADVRFSRLVTGQTLVQ